MEREIIKECREEEAPCSEKIIGILMIIAAFLYGIFCFCYEFKPQYDDWKAKEYVVEQSAKICLCGGSSHPLDQYISIKLITSEGEEVQLKLRETLNLPYNEWYEGSVVYTKSSKEKFTRVDNQT